MMGKKSLVALAVFLLILAGTLSSAARADAARSANFHDSYRLEKVVVLSRHNIRAPLVKNASVTDTLTPHKWFSWTSAPGELSLKGGQLETIMGQYFRQWLVDEKFMTENYVPAEGEMRFYANSKQRTIATARYFSGGMLPIANVTIEHKFAPEGSDPVFSARLTFMSDAFQAGARAEISRMGGENGLQGLGERLSDTYELLEKVLDFKDSPAAKKEGMKHFRTDDIVVTLEKGKQPSVKGSLKLAEMAADALALQYYEEADAVKAGFGHKLSAKEWEQIGDVKDICADLEFRALSLAVNEAHSLLQLMREELSLESRRFTFLCGHDANIAGVLAALAVEPYSLPRSVEKKTPIGAKVVIGKWRGTDGGEYVSLDLVYQSTDQLRDRIPLTLENPPMVFPLHLRGLHGNRDGLYNLQEVQQRFQSAIDAYDHLPQDVPSGAEPEVACERAA